MSLISRILYCKCKHIGKHTLIHSSTQMIEPFRISIETNGEIRQNCIFDARSNSLISIEIGENVRIKDNVNLAAYGGYIKIGKNVLIGRNTTIFGHGGVIIGDYSMLSPNVSIVSSNHVCYLDSDKSFQEQGFTREQIKIGNNVWIGCNAVVLAGVEIPNNVIVGAGSVVNKNLEAGSIYAGNPIKFIKRIESTAPNDIEIFFKDWGVVK